MAVQIRRVDQSLPLPRYESAGAVGFDLVSRLAADIGPGELARIPANVVVEVPSGHALLIASRSSTPARWGLLVPHGIGVIDQDYCGPDDEIHMQLLNFRSEPVHVPRGSRLAQGLLVGVAQARWLEVDSIRRPSRGGFGSTGGSAPEAVAEDLGETEP
ncbi:MAG: dUTPase [Dehalococcoidia bacterium]|nr:dUTPase [Dehalococcoidia bacterium]